MATLTPCTLPSVITAGDSISWTRAFEDYVPADGWTLAYTLVGRAAVHHIAATAESGRYRVALTPDDTRSWAAGRYRVAEVLANADQRITTGTQWLTVAPDLAGAGAGLDLRSHPRKVLDALEAWLESGNVTAGLYEFNGRKLQNYPLPDLLKLRDRYAAEVRREAAANGQGAGSRILVRL